MCAMASVELVQHGVSYGRHHGFQRPSENQAGRRARAWNELQAPGVTVNIEDEQAELATPAEGVEGFNEGYPVHGVQRLKVDLPNTPKIKGDKVLMWKHASMCKCNFCH